MNDKGYTTREKISEYLGGIDITSGDVDSYILATQLYIDNFTGRNFKAEETASIRKYNGNDRQVLSIDDCISITKVEIGNDIWGDTFTEVVNSGDTPEYYLLPTNYIADLIPITKIGLRTRSFIGGNANQRITAKWGYSEDVPADIQFSATVIASGMYYANRGENTGAIKSEKIGEYSVSYAEQGGFSDAQTALAIFNRYKLYEL